MKIKILYNTTTLEIKGFCRDKEKVNFSLEGCDEIVLEVPVDFYDNKLKQYNYKLVKDGENITYSVID